MLPDPPETPRAPVYRDPGIPMLLSARWSRALTQSELAAAVGTTTKTIWSLEHGRSHPSVTLAIALARALELTVEELFGD